MIFDKSPVMGQVLSEKVLQCIDFVEIGLRALIDDDCIYHPFALRFRDSINFSLLFKLLVYYERVNLIELLLTDKKLKGISDDLLTESLKYALSVDKITTAIFIYRKFHVLLFANLNDIFSTVTNNLAKYNDVTLRERGCGIMYLEEKLYLLELLLTHLKYPTAVRFFLVMKHLLNYGNDGEEVAPYGLQENDGNPMRVQE